eukprot:449387_1
MNFHEANGYCSSQYGTHLATEITHEEYSIMNEWMSDAAMSQVWLGITRELLNDAEWIWTDVDATAFTQDPLHTMIGITEQRLNSWYDAEEACLNNYGTHLASIESNLQQCSEYDIIWIGLNDLNKEDVFEWSDGTTSSYLNWRTGEPNGKKFGLQQDCVHQVASNAELQWKDRSCASKGCYLCGGPYV